MTPSRSPHAVWTRGLRKTFRVKGHVIEAVRSVDLQVNAGEIFSFLGPNGAGKTTTLRMLTTLLPIEGGEATIAGVDVARDPAMVRRRIGYVGQRGGADLPATGRENLVLQGQLYGATRTEATRRADELIEVLDLAGFADRKAQTYSGGQRRRLEVALGIMHRPEVLFLDEPTLGLDPQNRANLWNQIRSLRETGTTIFLTTHYLDEADALSEHVTIMDNGQIVADGSPHALKQQLAGDVITFKPGPGNRPVEGLCRELAIERFVNEARIEGETIRLYVDDGSRALPFLFDLLKARGVGLEGISLSAPSLDDVFLRQTGRSLRDAGPDIQEVPA